MSQGRQRDRFGREAIIVNASSDDCGESNRRAGRTAKLRGQTWKLPGHLLQKAIMAHGFLGYNATFMLDAVVCALLLLVPLLAVSVALARYGRNYAWHRRLQLILAGLLLAAVLAFEIDVQLMHGGWENIVRYARPNIGPQELDSVRKQLHVHLVFAISTPVLWGVTIGLALSRFPNPPAPSGHSRLHRWLGWVSAGDLALTSLTGLWFYYSAFVAASAVR
jgi:hypothetical protein